MLWTLFTLTFLVLLFENFLDFRSMKTCKKDAGSNLVVQRLLRRHALMAAFLVWGVRLIGLTDFLVFTWALAILFVLFVLIEIKTANRVLKGLKRIIWTVVMFIVIFIAATLFFTVMEPWLLSIMIGASLFVFVILFDRLHALFIERFARVVPYLHRMDNASFLGGLAFQDRAHMLDIKSMGNMKNAMVVGLFAPRRLYLSKAMLKSMRPEEIEGIIAHEVGHIRHKHILVRLLVVFIALAMFIISGLWVFGHLYMSALEAYTALFTSWFLLGTFFRVVIALIMQHQEFDADAYAKKVGRGEALQSALSKLKRQEESHRSPLQSLLYNTHPPIEMRKKRLAGKTRN